MATNFSLGCSTFLYSPAVCKRYYCTQIRDYEFIIICFSFLIHYVSFDKTTKYVYFGFFFRWPFVLLVWPSKCTEFWITPCVLDWNFILLCLSLTEMTIKYRKIRLVSILLSVALYVTIDWILPGKVRTSVDRWSWVDCACFSIFPQIHQYFEDINHIPKCVEPNILLVTVQLIKSVCVCVQVSLVRR